MAKSAKQPNKVVQTLLDERRRIEQWLERLSMAADKTSEGVRSKVERDYRARLEKVLEELEGHRDEMVQTLERHRKEVEEAVQKEAHASEELSEAELRHAVGEFSETEWTKVRTDILESLVKFREEIKRGREEIAGLEEVIESFEDVEVPDVPEDVEDAEDDDEVPALDMDEPEQPKRRGQTDAFDELAFLKSVTDDEKEGPRPERASGVHHQVFADEPDAESSDEGDKKKKKKKKPHRDTQVGAAGVTAVEAGPELTKGTLKRSLKCADCGTMNLPTEWYCENCGAELAAL